MTLPHSAERWTTLLALVLIALALFMGFYNLDGYLMNDDEETYLYGAWRVSLGELPYADFVSVQAPLSYYLAAGLFKIFGPSVWWARALSYVLVLGAALFVYGAAKSILRFSRLAALSCGVMFLFSKHVYFLGRSFMPECAMLFFGAGAIFFGLRAEGAENDREPPLRRNPSLFLFGVFAGLATLAKLNAGLLVVGYGFYSAVLWISGKETFRSVVGRLAFAAAGFLATFGIVYGLMLLFVPGTLQGTFGIHAAKSKIAFSGLLLLWRERLLDFLGNHNYGLIPLALAGMFFRPVFRDKKRIFLLLTLLAVLTQILMPVTFYLRYVVMALIPLSLFFGDGVEGLARLRRGVPKVLAVSAAAFLVLICLLPTFNPKKLTAYDQDTRDIAAFIRSQTGPGDYVFAETPFANFYAQRPCPPALVDVSMARTRSGQVVPADIRRECDRFRVKLIVVERGKSAHSLKNLSPYHEFRAYLDERYDLVKSMPREFLEADIYLRKAGT